MRLVAEAGLLRRDEGLGALVRQQAAGAAVPDRDLVRRTRDHAGSIAQGGRALRSGGRAAGPGLGRLPGSLVRDTKAEFVSSAGKTEPGKVTTLVVQPDAAGEGLPGFDAATIDALAEHLVHDMAVLLNRCGPVAPTGRTRMRQAETCSHAVTWDSLP